LILTKSNDNNPSKTDKVIGIGIKNHKTKRYSIKKKYKIIIKKLEKIVIRIFGDTNRKIENSDDMEDAAPIDMIK